MFTPCSLLHPYTLINTAIPCRVPEEMKVIAAAYTPVLCSASQEGFPAWHKAIEKHTHTYTKIQTPHKYHVDNHSRYLNKHLRCHCLYTIIIYIYLKGLVKCIGLSTECRLIHSVLHSLSCRFCFRYIVALLHCFCFYCQCRQRPIFLPHLSYIGLANNGQTFVWRTPCPSVPELIHSSKQSL